MDEFNISVITIYMTIKLSGCFIKTSLGVSLFNFQESILRNVTPFDLRIKKKPGITPKSINFLS